MSHTHIQKLCGEALESVRPILPDEKFADAYGYIHEYGEWGVGVEFIIDWIGDLELPISDAQFVAIEKAMIAMDWGDSERMRWLRGEFHRQRSKVEPDTGDNL